MPRSIKRSASQAAKARRQRAAAGQTPNSRSSCLHSLPSPSRSNGELLLKHAAKLGFEGMVPKMIDAPYPGSVGTLTISRCSVRALDAIAYLIVGVHDPEHNRIF